MSDWNCHGLLETGLYKFSQKLAKDMKPPPTWPRHHDFHQGSLGKFLHHRHQPFPLPQGHSLKARHVEVGTCSLRADQPGHSPELFFSWIQVSIWGPSTTYGPHSLAVLNGFSSLPHWVAQNAGDMKRQRLGIGCLNEYKLMVIPLKSYFHIMKENPYPHLVTGTAPQAQFHDPQYVLKMAPMLPVRV